MLKTDASNFGIFAGTGEDFANCVFASSDFFFAFVCFAGLFGRRSTLIVDEVDGFIDGICVLGDGIILSDFGRFSTLIWGKSVNGPCDNR